MKTEKFENVTISYMRRVGAYGLENVHLMEKLKDLLKSAGLFNDEMVLLGIALDDPATVVPDKQRYDVGIISRDIGIAGLDQRKLDDGTYAIFEVAHTQDSVREFWESLSDLSEEIKIDVGKPILERYTLEKINSHRCEFCVPLRE